MSCFLFLLIKDTYIFLSPIKMQSTHRLSIVIIKQDTEITLRISMTDAMRLYYGTYDGFYNKEPFKLLPRSNHSQFVI